MPLSLAFLLLPLAVSGAPSGRGRPAAVGAAGRAWDRIGPWNLFDDRDDKGEAGTIACAASPADNPDVIYAGGQNNGVSSGIIKTIDGGRHWTRNSMGLWDTRILGVWVHPDDPQGNHVFAGTHTGIYESIDGAGSWALRKETAAWGSVMSFREGTINGAPFIIANSQNGILTLPRAGGTWSKIATPGGQANNDHLSVVVTDNQTEVVTCIGNWGGGQLYYAALTSATTATWTGPLMAGNVTLDCANAAVDPNDRNHFLFSKGGEYRCWESKDAGKTVSEFTNHNTGVYFVMIDQLGWYFTATQAGAFVSKDMGATWDPYHVIMNSRSGRVVDRVPHDYQRIVPMFRGTEVALPSDQGLHIVNRSSLTLISAVGDMKNTMALSALIAPNANGSRNVIVNLWDWDVAASWDDGATWAGWQPTEQSPGACGEGGGGQSMGASGRMVMFHRQHWWSSADGGHNFHMGNLPGTGGGGFDYVRQPASRSEPAGTCFALMDATPQAVATAAAAAAADGSDSDEDHGRNYRPDAADSDSDSDSDADVDPGDGDPDDEDRPAHSRNAARAPRGTQKYLMTSEDFGGNWTWSAMPAGFQASGLVVDPTNPKLLYAWTSSCLAHTTDKGKTWSTCSTAKGLSGTFSNLLVKDAHTLFMLRVGTVPLRTTDGGDSWQELSAAAPLFAHGASLDGSLSWTGKTLILHGGDLGAIGRGEFGTSVWKSHDDGSTWTDETGDLVTISPGPGVWFDTDFYFVTRGEGVLVKRNFEAAHVGVDAPRSLGW